MCFRGRRGEGDEGGKAEQTRGGAERGCCCDDLKRKQRVALASAEREKEKTKRKGVEARKERSAREDEGAVGAREGCGCRDVSVEMRREE